MLHDKLFVVLAAMIGTVAVVGATGRQARPTIPDSILETIRGANQGKGTKTEDQCAGSNLPPSGITAADCITTPRKSLPCVSCGFGQPAMDSGKSGNRVSSTGTNPCSSYQLLVGTCDNNNPTFTYSCENPQNDPMNQYCSKGTFPKLGYQPEDP